MQSHALIVEIADLYPIIDDKVTRIVDCRFALQDPSAGRRAYANGHIPGAVFVDLNEDLSGPLGPRGGRHPLPPAAAFMTKLADLGIGLDTPVIAYDDNRVAGAARFWWLCQSLGYRQVRVLSGGWAAWLASGGPLETAERTWPSVPTPTAAQYVGVVDRDGAVALQSKGAVLIDAREPKRFAGLEEPIDPYAGHIPGALNLPWLDVTDPTAKVLPPDQQRSRWAEVDPNSDAVVVCYCGSGVTACVNILSRAVAGLSPGILYNGSWSDWCAWIQEQEPQR
jgi:thiosulfate/3-mercaptopyruvate sulfurtransferase